MPVLRPVAHLEAVSRDYPGVWRKYDQLLAQRAELGDWPPWCFCPMAGAYAIVSGGGDNRVPLNSSLEISRLAALAAWRSTKGVYRFDGTLLAELLETPISGDLPVEHLQRLPEWGVYVELPGPALHGFFAHLEYDPNDQRSELRLLLDQDSGLIPIALHLGSTIDAALAGFIAYANAQVAKSSAPIPAFGASVIQDLAPRVARLVSVLLYLCAGDAETRPTRDPKRRHERPGPKRGRTGEPYQPEGRPEVWETGFRLGVALRDARERVEADESARSVRGHVRRAHWHGYWKGSGDARRLELRWLSPILVNLDAAQPTIRKVGDEET